MSFIQPFIDMDSSVNAYIFTLRGDLATKIFLPITWLGEWTIVVILAILVSAFLFQARQKLSIVALWLTIIGSLGFTYLGKLLIERPRPLDAILIENSNSFPSAHATIAVAFYGFAAYILLKKTKLPRSLIILFTSIIILAIGFSRLYLGVHYPSDVLAGYLVGLVWLIVGIKFSSREIATTPAKQPPSPTI